MIGIIDSGVGGIAILKEIIKILPNEKYFYLADQNNFPYGEKTQEELRIITEKNIEYLINAGATLVVLACNTVTVNLISHLRSKYEIPFVGVEPAINLAILNDSKRVGILATESTLASDYLMKKIQEEVGVIEIINQSGRELIMRIEDSPLSVSDLDIFASPRFLVESNVDSIVLGCTHFHHYRKDFERLFPNIIFFDSGEGVANQVKKMYKKSNSKEKNITFVSTKDSEAFVGLAERLIKF